MADAGDDRYRDLRYHRWRAYGSAARRDGGNQRDPIPRPLLRIARDHWPGPFDPRSCVGAAVRDRRRAGTVPRRTGTGGALGRDAGPTVRGDDREHGYGTDRRPGIDRRQPDAGVQPWRGANSVAGAIRDWPLPAGREHSLIARAWLRRRRRHRLRVADGDEPVPVSGGLAAADRDLRHRLRCRAPVCNLPPATGLTSVGVAYTQTIHGEPIQPKLKKHPHRII